MEEAREKGGVETGGGSDGRWRRHERREVWRREVEVTRGGGGTRHGRYGDVGGSDERSINQSITLLSLKRICIVQLMIYNMWDGHNKMNSRCIHYKNSSTG